MRLLRRASPAFALLTTGLAGASPAAAQPDPSVRATCGELRAALAKLPPPGEDVVTIQVEGVVTVAKSDDALSVVVICRPPEPQVACITYTTEGRKPGDRVVVAGAYTPRNPDRIVLDPCIHFEAGTKQ